MKTLYIDTHYLDIIIALIEDGKIIRHKEVINKKNNSEFIFPTIIEVLNDELFDEIIVVNGPGSFTGVRLGVTIAKTFAYALNIPIKVIDSLKVINVSTNNKKIALSDGNGYYIGKFNDNHESLEDYYYLNNNDFDLLADKDEYLREFKYDILKVYNYLEDKDSINPHSAKPIYVKKIGVEIDSKSK